MPKKDFGQIDWDAQTREDCRELIRLSVREDLGREHDWTTVALVPSGARGRATIVARKDGVIAGLPAATLVLEEMNAGVEFTTQVEDGASVSAGTILATLDGPARSLLTAERPLLNFIGRLSGIATLTRQYIEAVAGTSARIYDTRKTTPGWRRLEKYAVRCGGGFNHRVGLFEAILIKDNHLVFAEQTGVSPAQAVLLARSFIEQARPETTARATAGQTTADQCIIEVEVDSTEQLQDVLLAGSDIVLLDNMSTDQLRSAVQLRNSLASEVELEASGGIDLTTVRAIAETGIDRISIGALTHGATWLDVALDWVE